MLLKYPAANFHLNLLGEERVMVGVGVTVMVPETTTLAPVASLPAAVIGQAPQSLP